MKYLASCSFGKDSIAAVLTRIKHDESIDELVYCKIMYNDTISAEFPEHEEFIHNVAIPKFEREYGLKTTIVQAERSYLDWFYRIKQKGAKIGEIYGFPYMRGQWCTSKLKTDVLQKYERSTGKHKVIVGLAVDETKRVEAAKRRGDVLPLVTHNITEAEAFIIAEKAGLLSPAYNEQTRRLGCWFCHNQNIGDLRYLRKNYPFFWQELLKLQEDTSISFKPRNQDMPYWEERFAKEEGFEQLKLKRSKK